MSNRVVRGFAALGTFALIAAFASSAVAQPAPLPVRVGQGSDGTLYVLQGGNSWTLVPDQLSDSEVATLNPGGEIDGTFPNQLFVVQAPAAPPVAAPPAPTPTPAPAVAPAPAPAPPPPDTGTDLTGKVASSPPGTSIAFNATYSSTIDANTKPKDVFSIPLSAGASYTVFFSSTNNYGGGGMAIQLLNPNSSSALNQVIGVACGGCSTASFTTATSGTYYLVMYTLSNGVRYTFTVKQT